MLTIQRQVHSELVEQHADAEAHLGTAALEHPGGRRRRQGDTALDERAPATSFKLQGSIIQVIGPFCFWARFGTCAQTVAILCPDKIL